MNITQALQKIRGNGFTIELEGDRLAVEPFDRLTHPQLQWLRSHKGEVLTELKAERVTIHVPDFQAANGSTYSFDLTVPKIHIPELRARLSFTLRNGQGGGSVLGAHGVTQNELRQILVDKYGDRLERVDS